MIVSVSRRTDIPAFYSEWFFKRIEEGFVYVINPMNRKQVSKVLLNTDTVDCFVFWTKDVRPMMDKLHILDEVGFKYYFQYTITSYHHDVEPGIKKKNEIIPSFQKLSDLIGPERVIWRYDPILLNEKYTIEYHIRWFEAICKRLCGYTNKCVISFLDQYVKTKRNTKELNIKSIEIQDIEILVEAFVKIARKYNMVIETCSEKIDLKKYGVQSGKCIDDRLISRILNTPVGVDKDNTQREECGCVKSIDIGQYNTCKHFCKYCYANFNYAQVNESCQLYSVTSPVLDNVLKGDEIISVREMKTIKREDCGEQLELHFEQKR